MGGLFGDLTVLDLTTGIAGPAATMMFADRGADVIRIEAPEGDAFPALDGGKVWNRGKRSAILDLENPSDRDALLALTAKADILVESAAPGRMDKLGLGYEALHAINPRLIYCSITGYGRGSRHSDRPAYDQLVAARTGVQWEARGWYSDAINRIKGRDPKDVARKVPESIRIASDRDGPIFTASPATSTITAYHTVLGISAALRARDLTGAGQWVEISMLQAVLGMMGWQRPAKDDIPGYIVPSAERRQTWGLVRAKDGFMCMWVSPPTWFTAAGRGETIVQPAPGTVNRAIRMSIEQRLDQMEEAAPIIRKFTVGEWAQAAIEDGNISCQPVRTPEQALSDPALMKDTAVVEVEDAELGVLRQAGAVYRMHARPIAVRWGAPRRGQHTDEIKAEAAASKAAPAPAPAAARKLSRGPMEGIRVIDFGAAVAGPWATHLLGEMGADVIKVDPPRQVGWMGTNMAHQVNRTKRWMGLDAKTPGGAKIARQLVEGADVVMLNLRPQAARKLGLDYETLSKINPRLVYCHTRGFEDGPRSELPGNDQTGNSLGGTTWEDGGCWNGGRPWFGPTSNGDLGNGYLACIGITQALYDRERTGKGQKVDAAIVNASLFNNSRVYTDRAGTTFDRPTLDADQTGFWALYRIYRCSDDQWICLAVFSDAQWRALATAMPSLAADPRFATREDRTKNDGALADALRALFASGAAHAWFEQLDAAGVPCEISDPHFSQKVFDDPEFIARKLVANRVGNPNTGPVDVHGRLIDFSDTPTEPGAAPPVMWRDTREILRELGYGDVEIDKLAEEGAVVLPQPAAALAV
jgi:crotonobetainyl-CoA:carnitine CoA-transferase CaiB-like acyl-CoA transferase